ENPRPSRHRRRRSIRYVDGNHALSAIADPFAAAEVLEEPPPPSLRTSRSPSGHRGKGSPRPPSSSERGMTPGRSSSGLPPPPTLPAEGEIPGPVSSSLCSAMLCREAGGGGWVDEQRGKIRCRRSVLPVDSLDASWWSERS
uniref:Uncharacterized protein n=3 Tax=Aegilops tauschii subsp. strangulata TaxID=200361 RepID=A0A453JNL7_AEGTS